MTHSHKWGSISAVAHLMSSLNSEIIVILFSLILFVQQPHMELYSGQSVSPRQHDQDYVTYDSILLRSRAVRVHASLKGSMQSIPLKKQSLSIFRQNTLLTITALPDLVSKKYEPMIHPTYSAHQTVHLVNAKVRQFCHFTRIFKQKMSYSVRYDFFTKRNFCFL